MALSTWAAFLCVILATVAFAAQAELAARGDLSTVKRDSTTPYRNTYQAPSYAAPTGPLPGYPPPK
uniref:Uncharacterized protein n=1 Tax=Aegilops tauschii TaxID=37682 RepID=M8BIM2_AEGTA